MSKMDTSQPASAEMRPGPGFQICSSIRRPPSEVIDGLREFETPEISDVLNRMYAMCPQIQNIVNDDSIVGPAITVKVYPGDNLMVHKALDFLQKGDIVVVDASSTNNNATIGDLIARKAKHRGAIGFVIDGLIRDIPGLQELNLPVFARGKSPLGPLHRGPGEINYPISCGGIAVNPGDVISADETGVVVIRKEFVNEVLNTLRNEKQKNADYIARVKSGAFTNKWVDDVLNKSGCNNDDE